LVSPSDEFVEELIVDFVGCHGRQGQGASRLSGVSIQPWLHWPHGSQVGVMGVSGSGCWFGISSAHLSWLSQVVGCAVYVSSSPARIAW